MRRRRLGVVLLVPEPWAQEIQGLRRGLGDRSLDRVPPHLTLVPPVNVRAEDMGDALRILRAAAVAQGAPLTLDLGPVRSFVPDSDTAYLAVAGDDAAVHALERLRRGVFQGPLERVLEFPFVAHVTISEGIEPARIAAGVEGLSSYGVTASFDRVHLLEEQRVDGHRRWVPIADAPFAPPAIVGRGGVELELTRGEVVDPEAQLVVAAAAAEADERDHDETLSGVLVTDDALVLPVIPLGTRSAVVTARQRDVVVGVASGWSHPELRGEVLVVAVDPTRRGEGIATQVRRALESDIG